MKSIIALATALSLALMAPVYAGPGDDHGDEATGEIKLTDEQVRGGEFEIQKVQSGAVGKTISVPGTITPSADHIARVSVRLIGTVAEIYKKLADPVQAGEVMAVIESREVADAKSQYLAANTAFNLQDTLFQRSQRLFNGNVLSENEFLRARQANEDMRIKLEVAKQKLFALGMTAEQIEALPSEPPERLRMTQLRAPISGKVAERRIELGALVGREGVDSEFVIVDTSVVWVELAVSPGDLSLVHEGQTIDISADGQRTQARVMYVSPLLNAETRTARVIASINNPQNIWRPGGFVTAVIAQDHAQRTAVVPTTALQTIDSKPVVFVRTEEGFERRDVVTGSSNGGTIAILRGLSEGEFVATKNTFVLKAELGKDGVDHAH